MYRTYQPRHGFLQKIYSVLHPVCGAFLLCLAALIGFMASTYGVHEIRCYVVRSQAEIVDKKLADYARTHPDPNVPEHFLYPVSVMFPEDIDGQPVPKPEKTGDKILSRVFPKVPFSHTPEANFFTLHYVPLKADGTPWRVGEAAAINNYILEYFVINGNVDVMRRVSKGSFEGSTYQQ